MTFQRCSYPLRLKVGKFMARGNMISGILCQHSKMPAQERGVKKCQEALPFRWCWADFWLWLPVSRKQPQHLIPLLALKPPNGEATSQLQWVKKRLLDNSRVHQNAEIVKFVEETDRLEVVFLPAYAPELNPIELLWAWVKRHWLANLVVLSVDELRGLWRDALWVAGHTPGLVKGFFGRLERILEENLKPVSA